MVKMTVSVHPQGLHPFEAVRAWQLHKEEGLSLSSVQNEFVDMEGEHQGEGGRTHYLDDTATSDSFMEAPRLCHLAFRCEEDDGVPIVSFEWHGFMCLVAVGASQLVLIEDVEGECIGSVELAQWGA